MSPAIGFDLKAWGSVAVRRGPSHSISGTLSHLLLFTAGQNRFWGACYDHPSLVAQLFHLLVSLLCRVSSGALQQQSTGQMWCFSHCAVCISSNIADLKGRLGS